MNTPVPTNTPVPQPPAAPTDLTGSPQGAGIRLRWTDQAATEDGYTVYRSSDGGESFELIATLAPDTKSYRDMDVPSGTYDYYVTASSVSGGESIPSNQVTVAEN
ncbi:MAG: hypothetical protein M3R02_06285 [Chloroflexota bacterium]|nr:hypothetical protein [Chloroflexota bacterium]